MRLTDVEKYTNELQGLVGSALEARSTAQQLTGLMKGAREKGDAQRAKEVQQEWNRLHGLADIYTEAALKESKRPDLEAARTLLVDLQVKIDAAHREYRSLRQLMADFEFNVAMDRFAQTPEEGVTREQAERMLDEQKARVEKRVELAGLLVPERVVILGTGA
jgi:hypothetical protein